MLRNDDRQPNCDAVTDLQVPSALLAHELGTPINVLQGYTRLLASGAFGPLDDDTSDAVQAMRNAVGTLSRTLALLTPTLPPPPLPGAPRVDLVPVLAEAWRAVGCRRIAAEGFRLEGDAWSGWPMVLEALLAAVLHRGVETVTVRAADGELGVVAKPGGGGSGDDALATWVAQTRAGDAGLRLETRRGGSMVIAGRALQRGAGHVVLARK